MSCVVVEIAKAVAATIKAASTADDLSRRLCVERLYIPPIKLEDIENTHVWVVGADETRDNLTRGKIKQTVPIGVALAKHCAKTTNDVIDPLMLLLEELKDLMRRRVNALAASLPYDVSFIKVENTSPLYSPKHLIEMDTFYAVTTYTFLSERKPELQESPAP